MASRSRLPPPRKKKSRITQPSTADEYLAVGVELEEAAEKWRAGDAVKALRFYDRALTNYDEALNLWPQSFDMAYNKARIQFAVTQHPKLRTLLSVPISQQLSIALASHRVALKLAPKDADAVFNTAQILTAIADELGTSAKDNIEKIALLTEATSLFLQCLEAQDVTMRQQQGDFDRASDEQDASLATELPSSCPSPTSSHSDAETWAAIEEPTTPLTLTETGIGLFDALTALCKVLPPGDQAALQSVEMTHDIAWSKMQLLLSEVDDEARASLLLCEARLKNAMLEAAFEAGRISVKDWDQALKACFEPFEATSSAAALSAYAEALSDLATAADGLSDASLLRYNRISKALGLLASAARVAEGEELANIHALRGDMEVLRHRLSFSSGLPADFAADNVRQTFLENAGKFYRGASSVSAEAPQSFTVKNAIVECLMCENPGPAEGLVTQGVPHSAIAETLQDMFDELLLAQSVVNRSGLVSWFKSTAN